MADPIKYVSLANLTKYDGLIKTYIGNEDAKAYKTISYDEDTRVLSFFKAATPAQGAPADFTVTLPMTDTAQIEADIAQNTADIATNAAAIEAINNETTGILAVAEKYTDDEIDKIEELIGAIKEGSTVAEEIAAAETAAKGYTDSSIGTLGEKSEGVNYANVKDYVDTKVAAAATAGAVTISTDTTTEGALKTYTFTQNGAEIGKIDLAKDLVVTAGRVVKNPDGQPEGTYLELTIANQEAKVYINVLDLVNDFTVEQSAAKVQLDISDTREISADIVTGSIEKTDLVETLQTEITNATTAIGVASTEEAAGTGLTGRIEELEEAIGEGGAVAEQIEAAIADLKYDTAPGEGDDYVASITEVDGVIAPVYGSFNFDEAGAAAAVQGETTSTVKDVEDKIDAYIPMTDAEVNALFGITESAE